MISLDDILLLLLDDQPQRPLGLWGVITGRKTASIMFAGLQHQQLHYFGLLAGLSKPDYLAAVQRLLTAKLLQQTDEQVWRTATGRARCAQLHGMAATLASYDPELNVQQFAPRFFLAVQVLSEASYQQRQYVPLSADWQVQQYVRRWYHGTRAELADTVQELTVIFSQLHPATADYLAMLMIGHEYVGSGADQDSPLRRELALCDLLHTIESRPASAWQRLWGGRISLLPPAAAQTSAEFLRGASVQELVARKHRRISTITEHLQLAAIMGQQLPLDRFLSVQQQAVLATAWAGGQRTYQELLAALPGVEFLQVRMFQIMMYRRQNNAR
ncbi:helix-turn-helix domain-containing protein [Lacticaseibacillus zhaodongensis]|uniref:helix-turn-helix domain-containing protein n=1 Tax=Lacticaseibacillus zhaodongensis TaxID=2668065 RepID=UPI0018AF847C|nr:helix-turn-helix domain-containing protein [Lacticaseibacillus zhaodongensis]